MHYHQVAEQFFYVLKGTATFDIEGETFEVSEREGIHIKPTIKHQIQNKTNVDLEFLVISKPSTKDDRINQ